MSWTIQGRTVLITGADRFGGVDVAIANAGLPVALRQAREETPPQDPALGVSGETRVLQEVA